MVRLQSSQALLLSATHTESARAKSLPIRRIRKSKRTAHVLKKDERAHKIKTTHSRPKKGNWTEEEDQKLRQWVSDFGPLRWTDCSKTIKGRCGKQCRERWVNILNPTVKKGQWTHYEQEMIFESLCTNSTAWSTIAKQISGRTENSIKNYFYSSVRRIKASILLPFIKQSRESPVKIVDCLNASTGCQNTAAFPENVQRNLNHMNTLSQKLFNLALDAAPCNPTFQSFVLSLLFEEKINQANAFAEDLHRPLPSPILVINPCRLPKTPQSFLDHSWTEASYSETKACEEVKEFSSRPVPRCWNCLIGHCFRHGSQLVEQSTCSL